MDVWHGPPALVGEDEDRHGAQECKAPEGAAPTGVPPIASLPRAARASLQKCLPWPGGAMPFVGGGRRGA